MKIVQILPELNEGGVERGVVELSRELIKHGIQNIVISKGGKLVQQIEQDGGVHIQLDVRSKNILSAPWRIFQLYRKIKKISPDIVHVRSRVPAWMFFFANKFLHIPVVATVHGFNSVNRYSAIMVHADQIICASSFLIDHVVTHFHADPQKISLIPRGIDFNYFETNALDQTFISHFKNHYKITSQHILLHVARITHWKDQATTIRAFLELRKQRDDIKLFLVGGVDPKRTAYASELHHLVNQSSFPDDIVFLGSQAQMKELYALATLSISSSTKPETFGRANVESLAMGKPLIATPIGATKDYVIEGRTGFFFEPKNYHDLAIMINKTLNSVFNPHDIQSFAQTHFSLEQMVEKNIRVYQSLI